MARPEQTWRKLHDISKWQKEQAQLQLAHALARQEKVEQQLLETQAALDQLDRTLTDQQRAGTRVAMLRQAGEYAQYLSFRLTENQLALDRARQQTSRSRQNVLHYTREEKKWQILMDKQLNRLLEEERRREQSEMDEAAGRIYLRERRPGSEQLEGT
jgi:flagellar export protein FliJ